LALASVLAASAAAGGDPAKVRVTFAPTPDGAAVLVEGRLVCRATPCTVEVLAGSREVKLVRERYAGWSQEVELTEGLALRPSLEQDLAWLTVRSEPPGLPVLLDGVVIGATPLEAREVPPGAHALAVEGRCHEAQGQRLELRRAERREVVFRPQARKAGLEVRALDPTGEVLKAQVIVDQRLLGDAPGVFAVPLCAAQLEVRAEGLGGRRRGLDLRERETLRYEVVFRAEEERSKEAPAGFVLVEGGSFQMGSPPGEVGREDHEAQRLVTVSRPYFLGAREVTQREWQEVTGHNPAGFKACGLDCPVERVSWWDVVWFLNKLSERDGLPACYRLDACQGTPGVGCSGDNERQCDGNFTCQSVSFSGLDCPGWRLPTEAEWEYAARANAPTPPAESAGARGWLDLNSGGMTHPGGLKEANVWGLYDMYGNVSEWVWDGFDYQAQGSLDPLGNDSLDTRAARGGYYGGQPQHFRPSYRYGVTPMFRGAGLGFRAARTWRE
jgi:formylglycine-generating enzyme required for sulfatase activity